MRVVTVLTVLLTMLAIPGAAAAGQTEETRRTNAEQIRQFRMLQAMGDRLLARFNHQAIQCKSAEKAIVYYRDQVWEHQDLLGEGRSSTRYPENRKVSCAYKRYAAEEWRNEASEYGKLVRKLDDARIAICYVFGTYCQQALAVAACESGFNRFAVNGQYLGMFQMGSYARSVFGHSHTPVGQARAAYAYFVASGRDWSPWSCKPW